MEPMLNQDIGHCGCSLILGGYSLCILNKSVKTNTFSLLSLEDSKTVKSMAKISCGLHACRPPIKSLTVG